ncbi:MAG: DUF1887 family protein [Chlorobi bacterium]|nr:DUF1887 family protein [Chlorobiota bacterium]
MATYIVSIVSQQTLPNYLFIKEHQSPGHRYVFISSQKMEEAKKTRDIVETAGMIKGQYVKTLIEEDEFYLARQKLDRLHLPRDAEYLVNLTGGTKLMAMAVREYFKTGGFTNARFFYIPVDKNHYKEIFDDRPAEVTPFTYRLSTREYLSIYGMEMDEDELVFSKWGVEQILNDVKRLNFPHHSHIGDTFIRSAMQNRVPVTDQHKTKWFEEYLYYRVKETLKLKSDFISTGIKLRQRHTIAPPDKKAGALDPPDNEIDLFFMYENRPYVAEVKYSLPRKNVYKIKEIQNILFKLSAVNTRFGLNVYSTLMTLADLRTLSEEARWHLKNKCRILRLHYPFDRHDILERFEARLNEFLAKRLPEKV